MHPTDAASPRRAAPAVIGVIGIGVWVLLLLGAIAHQAPVQAAYQAHLDTLDNPPILQDPPPDVARAEFFLGAVAVLASPVAWTALGTGLTTALHPNPVGARVLGWTTFVIGAGGTLPALGVSVFGVITCWFDALVLLG